MELTQAIRLIQKAPLAGLSGWADLGCGRGLFTNALAHLLGEGSTIYAVDRNPHDLNQLQLSLQVNLRKLPADFIQDDLHLKELDGILMANSLHFVKDKAAFAGRAKQWLKPDGAILLVEYDMDTANPWVPYPLSFAAADRFFSSLGYRVQQLGRQPSRYQSAGMYAAWIDRT